MTTAVFCRERDLGGLRRQHRPCWFCSSFQPGGRSRSRFRRLASTQKGTGCGTASKYESRSWSAVARASAPLAPGRLVRVRLTALTPRHRIERKRRDQGEDSRRGERTDSPHLASWHVGP